MSAPASTTTDFDAGMPSVSRRNWIALGTIARREVSRILALSVG